MVKLRGRISDTFYLYVFDPHNFGWSVAYTFSGMSLAIGVMVAFDMVLWPDPAERKLLRSLADTLDRQCQRLAAIGRAYLDPLGATVLPSAVPSFRYCPRSSLYWNAPDASSIIQQREAILLAAVTTTERLHIEIEQIAGDRARQRPARYPRAAAARD